MMPHPPIAKDNARDFFTRLEAHLNETIPTFPTVRDEIAKAVQKAKSAARGTAERTNAFAEGAFLNTYVIKAVHAFLTTELGSADRARLALLSESYKARQQLTSGSPVRPGAHPFRKVAASPKEIINIWQGRAAGRKPVAVNSCPDMALRAPAPYRTVIEAKYHTSASKPNAEAELLKNIYQAFFYLALPRLPQTPKHAAWDYDYACVLAYYATPSGVMRDAWNSLPKEVRGACWNGANLYVMVLRPQA